jgi:adenylate cyclase
MFLDMKNSTTIAEQLGHQRYFELLHLYYDTMSDAIINHYGEVYQYIGDEVVVSWKAEVGLENRNCIRCFQEIKAALHGTTARFEKQFGLVPDFKAAMHIGEVTTGEIGALKKEIVFTGDVVNTTARIQEQCKKHKVDLIISEALRLALNEPLNTQTLGEVTFKGKTQPTLIHAVAFG